MKTEETRIEAPAGINFEISPIEEDWMSGLEARSCVSCFTMKCVCCDPGSGHPACPEMGGVS